MTVADIHTHGIGGYETRAATPQDILRIAEIHGTQGIDAIIPAIYPAPIKQMRRDITAVQRAMEIQAARKNSSRLHVEDSKRIGQTSDIVNRKSWTGVENNDEYKTLDSEQCAHENTPAAILGVHLEGPFLNPARAGALDKTSFLSATMSNFEELIENFQTVVKIITIAPELDGAPDLIRLITDAGIIVSMGHSDATYGEAEAGFNAGAKGITHLFNAMRGIHHREPGITGFGLINPHVYVEVIADPFHLHPKSIELIFRTKESNKIIIVSDSVKSTQANNGGHAVTDPAGMLVGGSMTVAGSAQYLIGLGFKKDLVGRCTGCNPTKYLSGQP